MIDCLRRHEEHCRNLPWWRKDYYGCPIETYVGKPIKSFYRLVAINIKKPFQAAYWWWRRRKGPGKFESISFPVIKNMDYQWAAKELVSVQPEKQPAGLVFYLDFVYSDKQMKGYKMTRQEVYKLIDGERKYQDKKWPQTPALPPSDELRLVRVLLEQSDQKWYVTQDIVVGGVKINPADLDTLRKIAGVCVRAIETYGAPSRKEQ